MAPDAIGVLTYSCDLSGTGERVKVRFGGVVLDDESRQLWRNGTPVHLSLKAFELLSLLLHNRPAAVSKSDIQEHLWPSTFVTEGNIASLIAKIREAIGDTGDASHIIRTVHGFGYAFDADVNEEAATVRAHEARCVLVGETGEYPLGHGVNLIGRDQQAAVRLDFTTVSRQHARILVTDDGAWLEDLQSKNGTYVRDTKVCSAVMLSDGDRIRVGSSVLLTFKTLRPGAATTLEAP
jgi:DNA-binding winged helix-turn-helix (wHTH) protein